MSDNSENFPRLRDLPVDEQQPFGKWLFGQTCPVLEGLPDSEQDAYYPDDYDRWKHIRSAKQRRAEQPAPAMPDGVREAIAEAQQALKSSEQKYQDGLECVPFCEVSGAMKKLLAALAPYPAVPQATSATVACPECGGKLPWCQLKDRIENYLGNGGLFNPEFMEHRKVSELLQDILTAIRAHVAAAPDDRSAELLEEETVEIAAEAIWKQHQNKLASEGIRSWEDCPPLGRGITLAYAKNALLAVSQHLASRRKEGAT